MQRFFGRASVSYNNWAFLEATGSYDMDSRLGNPYNFKIGDISFFYPGANISVVLSDAIAALKNSKNISYLKVRAAISKTGNVNLGNYLPGQNTYFQPTGFPYSTLIGFSANNTLLRPTYKPEFVLNKEVGIEIGLLKNRINIEASYYTQDNTDQLITVAYSGSTGFPTALLNAAAFTNKGLELDLKLTPLVKIGKATINFKVNYTNQSNKVTKLIDGVDELPLSNFNFVITFGYG